MNHPERLFRYLPLLLLGRNKLPVLALNHHRFPIRPNHFPRPIHFHQGKNRKNQPQPKYLTPDRLHP
jgi:hypothetical protein